MVLPLPVMVPAVAPQVTLLLVAFATVAVIVWLADAVIDTDVGETVTCTDGGGGGGGVLAPVEPQAASTKMQNRITTARRAARANRTILRMSFE
jgi:hypothetical protein